MSDEIVERVRALSERLSRVEFADDDRGEAADLREAAVLAIEILAEDEPEWFALASLLAHMEDSARWVIDRRVRALRAT
jgi:hypothetical protein